MTTAVGPIQLAVGALAFLYLDLVYGFVSVDVPWNKEKRLHGYEEAFLDCCLIFSSLSYIALFSVRSSEGPLHTGQVTFSSQLFLLA